MVAISIISITILDTAISVFVIVFRESIVLDAYCVTHVCDVACLHHAPEPLPEVLKDRNNLFWTFTGCSSDG